MPAKEEQKKIIMPRPKNIQPAPPAGWGAPLQQQKPEGESSFPKLKIIPSSPGESKSAQQEEQQEEQEGESPSSSGGGFLTVPSSSGGAEGEDEGEGVASGMLGPKAGGATFSTSSSPTVLSSPSTTTSTAFTSEEDQTCDLCNKREVLDAMCDHIASEHAILRYWTYHVAAASCPANRDFASSSSSSSTSSATDKKSILELGSLAVEIAQRKDAGTVAWQAACNVWQQVRTVIGHRKLELRVFGSCIAMGSWDGKGDIDLCYVTPEPKLSKFPYPAISVSDEGHEVLKCARLLRDSGFAFDDLQPIVRTRVPIVKHSHRAPAREDAASGWKEISDSVEARSIRLLFNQAPSSIMQAVFAADDECEWRGRSTLIIKAKTTAAAVAIYCDPWKYAKERHERVVMLYEHKLVRLRQKVVKETAFMKEQNEGESTPALEDAVAEEEKMLAEFDKVRKFTRGSFESELGSLKKSRNWYSMDYYRLPELFHCDFDLSFRSHGIRNSILLRSYFSQTPLARVGAAFVKAWSKNVAINLSMRGYLTTYAINIIWIFFLIQRKIVKFVDPESIPVYVTDEEFERDLLKYIPCCGDEDIENNKEKKKDLEARVGSLLYEFFYFYAYEFDWNNQVITLRQAEAFTRHNVSTAPEEKPWIRDNEIQTGKFRNRVWYRLCIDDPYEPNLSLGRHLSPGKAEKIVSQFRFMVLHIVNRNSSSNSSSSSSVVESCLNFPFVGSSSLRELDLDRENDEDIELVQEINEREAMNNLWPSYASREQQQQQQQQQQEGKEKREQEGSTAEEEEKQKLSMKTRRARLMTVASTFGRLGYITDLTPDAVTAVKMRPLLSRWLIGVSNRTPLSKFLQSLDEQALFVLACANSFTPITDLFSACQVDLVPSKSQEKNRGMSLMYRGRGANDIGAYVPEKTMDSIIELEKEISESEKGFVLITQRMANKMGLSNSSHLSALRNLFPHTDLMEAPLNLLVQPKNWKQEGEEGEQGAGENFLTKSKQELRIFRSREDKENFFTSSSSSSSSSSSANSNSASAATSAASGGSGNSSSSSGGGGGGASADRRDISRSIVGTCDECKKPKRRLYGSAVNKQDRSRYCESCWDQYEADTSVMKK